MMKKVAVTLLLLLSLALSACAATDGSGSATEATAIDTPSAEAEAASVQEASEDSEGAAVNDSAVEENAASTSAEAETSTDAAPRTFSIAPGESEVRFVIDEVLRGNPTTVVGANSGVSGEMTIDPANPANTQIGAIEVDAAGFVTDEDRRNGAIRRFILVSDRYTTITFTPTEISGLPESASVGDSFNFQVTGDLTILERTNPVTFDVTATVVSDSELQITGASTISRGDFGITIPRVPFVASVDEELALELELVAVAN